FFFSSRRRHTSFSRDWSSDVCSSDLGAPARLADTLHLDLRLSAASAAAGPAQLNNVAAAIQLKDELMTFDISDSTAFGGSIVTRSEERRVGKESRSQS